MSTVIFLSDIYLALPGPSADCLFPPAVCVCVCVCVDPTTCVMKGEDDKHTHIGHSIIMILLYTRKHTLHSHYITMTLLQPRKHTLHRHYITMTLL